jgi:hypothetical protein
VPTVEFPPRFPLTIHETEAFVAPVTVALNCCEFPAVTTAVGGEIERPEAAGWIVTKTEFDAAEFPR